MRKLHKDCATQDLTIMEAALRWVFHHSALENGDGVVIGASREQQVMESIAMLRVDLYPLRYHA